MDKKTVLILGAGVTRAARPKAPLKTRPPLDSDFFEIARRVSKYRTEVVQRCLRSLVGDYANVLAESLETSTTYLYMKAIDAKSGSRYHIGFIQLLSLLNSVLQSTTNPLRIGPRSLIYRFIRSELARLDTPSDLTIITFNYDLVLERTLEALDLHRGDDMFLFPGCYRLDDVTRIEPISGDPSFRTEYFGHDGVALLKLHGSMNWQSVHTSNRPTSSALFKPSRELHVMDSPMIPQSLRWRRRRKTVYLKPVIVPPVSGKRGMIHKQVLPLWAKAGAALQEADRVVIAGYSCPPLDLEARILLSESLRANKNKKVYVINPNADIFARFVDICGVDRLTAYSSIVGWIRDARVPTP